MAGTGWRIQGAGHDVHLYASGETCTATLLLSRETCVLVRYYYIG